MMPHRIEIPPGYAERINAARAKSRRNIARLVAAYALGISLAFAFIAADRVIVRAIEAHVWGAE
jgi:hypothetical protein